MALSSEQREEIRRRHVAGEGPSSIARALGVARNTVWRLLREAPVPRSAPSSAAAAGAAEADAELAAGPRGGRPHARTATPADLAPEATTDELRDVVRASLVAQVARLQRTIDRIDAAVDHELEQGELGAELRPSRVRELVWSRATLQDKLAAALTRVEEIDKARPKAPRKIKAVFRPRVVRLEDAEGAPSEDGAARTG